jgi:hypothetical protein
MRLLAAAALLLALAAPCAAEQARVSLSRLPGKAYELHGEFDVPASSGTVWGVLTDYEGIPGFVASMRSSRVRETRADGSILVEQKASGGLFFLKRTVTILLEVRRGGETLEFEDVGRESFWRYEGAWSARPGTEGTKVSYRLLAQPDFVAPPLLMDRAMRRGARDLLDAVRAEILRREGGRPVAYPP